MTRPLVDATPIWLRRFTKAVAASTLFLIFAGAMVTSTGSGLAVPDWPLSYGMVFPPMVGGIFYEHGHRMIAAAVGLLTVIQAIWLHFREPKRVVRLLGYVSVGAVCAQGLLGGLTVLHFLPLALSVSHAAVGEIFLCLNVSIALMTSAWFAEARAHVKGDAPVGLTTALVVVTYSQVLVGALMRHLGAGLAIPDFPLAFGRLVPALNSTAITVNFAHRVGAVVVTLMVLAVGARLLRFAADHPLRRIYPYLFLVIPTQIMLGAYTVWSGKQPIITSLHVMTGALTLALSLVLALTARATAWRTGAAAIPAARPVRETADRVPTERPAWMAGTDDDRGVVA